jgi:hypothetical protein
MREVLKGTNSGSLSTVAAQRITSSAWKSSVGGMVRSRAWAVLMPQLILMAAGKLRGDIPHVEGWVGIDTQHMEMVGCGP